MRKHWCYVFFETHLAFARVCEEIIQGAVSQFMWQVTGKPLRSFKTRRGFLTAFYSAKVIAKLCYFIHLSNNVNSSCDKQLVNV